MAQNPDMKQAIADWLKEITETKRLSPRALAIAAKVSPSTVYRAMDMESEFTPTVKTVEKIAARLGVPSPNSVDNVTSTVAFRGFAEGELSKYDDYAPPAFEAGNNQGAWILNNRSLELEGLLPGDVIIVDMGVEPVPGDIVCAQIYNFNQGSAETVLRIYEPPYLLTNTMDRRKFPKPILIDNDRVAVVGTMIRLIRERQAS